MNAQEQTSKELGHAIQSLVAKADTFSTDAMIKALDEIGHRFGNIAPSPNAKLETQRRVAEWKFKLLCERDASVEVVEKLHDEIAALEFTNLETEATVEVYFAQYLVRASQSDRAVLALKGLLKRLSTAPLSGDPLALQLRAEVEALLGQLR